MIEMSATARYLRLTELAQKAFSLGRLQRSLELFSAAEEEARRTGDRELADRAFCNRCVALLELDQLSGSVGELKQVLMRSQDPFTSWMAAHYTAQLYEAEGNLSRALAYARRADDLAEVSGETRLRAASANQRGVLALRDSQFEEAARCFQTALQLLGETRPDELNTAIFRDNLGYCLMCTKQVDAGMELCRQAAATLESMGARQFLAEVLQDLCYGALQQGNLDEATMWGEQALQLAMEFANETVERNTLMLLADAAMDTGDQESADGYLDKLCTYYPDFQGMKVFLQTFNVREVINLKA